MKRNYYNLTYAAFNLPVNEVIITSRLALSLLTFFAIYIDPIESSYPIYAYAVSGAYTFYAALTYILYRRGHASKWWHTFAYFSDFTFSSTVVFLTGGASSPLSMLFAFPLLVATLHWNWRGAITTCVLLIALLTILSLAEDGTLTGDHDEINRFVIQGAFLLVAGLMLGHVGAFREQSLERLAALASWPPEMVTTGEFPRLEHSLAHAASVMRAHRVLVLWEQGDEPFLFTSIWSRGRRENMREAPGKYGEFVAVELMQATFMLGDPGHDRAIARQIGCEDPMQSINADLARDYGIGRFVTAPFTTTHASGRVFVLEPDAMSGELLALVSIVANRVAIEIEHHVLRMELDAAAALKERARLARDMHDGVLQTLTAIGLRLASGMDSKERGNTDTLDELREMLAGAQRRLREFVQSAYAAKRITSSDRQCPSLSAIVDPAEVTFDLEAECSRALSEASRHWSCDTRLRVSPQGAQVMRHIGRQVTSILTEAVANAVQHGRATTVEVAITRRTHSLELTISDDGMGLPGLTGTLDHDVLFDKNVGPRTIRERVRETGGSLSISSSPSGVSIDIGIPLS